MFYLGGDAYSAPAIWKNEQTASTTTAGLYYLHRDYQGSILMITDANGAIKEQRQFDAWGNIVKLTDGAGNALTAFLILDRGYTGHEHLLGVGLINMNGRLYDPLLHRFLSPDEYVQDPSNTQNFNRYGYVLNNPLKYTDPSGNYGLWDDLGVMFWGGATNVISQALSGNIHSLGQGLFYFAVGAISAEVTYYAGPYAGGAVLSIGNNLVGQVSQKGWSHISTSQLLVSGATGLATAWGGDKLGGLLSPALTKATSWINSPFLQSAANSMLSTAASGLAFGMGGALLAGENIGDAFREGLSNAGQGAIMGAITGGVEGYKFAKENNLDLWTGARKDFVPIEQPQLYNDVQIDNELNFADKPAMHMENPDRYVPVRILQEGILSSPGLPDPQGSPALMHHTIMWKNETPYNLEILYNKGTKTIYHFKYSHIKK